MVIPLAEMGVTFFFGKKFKKFRQVKLVKCYYATYLLASGRNSHIIGELRRG